MNPSLTAGSDMREYRKLTSGAHDWLPAVRASMGNAISVQGIGLAASRVHRDNGEYVATVSTSR